METCAGAGRRVSGSSSPSVVCERVGFLVLLVKRCFFCGLHVCLPASLYVSTRAFSLDLEALLTEAWVPGLTSHPRLLPLPMKALQHAAVALGLAG